MLIYHPAQINDLFYRSGSHIAVEVFGRARLDFIKIGGGTAHGMDQIIGGVNIGREAVQHNLLGEVALYYFYLLDGCRV